MKISKSGFLILPFVEKSVFQGVKDIAAFHKGFNLVRPAPIGKITESQRPITEKILEMKENADPRSKVGDVSMYI